MAVTGVDILCLQWCMLAFTFSLVCMRLYVRVYKRSMWKWNDIFVVIAWTAFALQNCLDTVLFEYGFFDADFVESELENGAEGLANLRSALIISWIENFSYYACPYAVKASMLFFYFEIIPPLLPKTYIALWITVAITSIGYLFYLLTVLFACQPISSNWALDPEEACFTADKDWAVIPALTFHMVTDLMVYLLPIPLLREMHNLTKMQRWGLGLLFGLGVAELGFGATYIIWRFYAEGDLNTSWIFTCMEQTWALVIVCLPAFKSFLKRDFWAILKRRKRTLETVEVYVSDDEKEKSDGSVGTRSRENSEGRIHRDSGEDSGGERSVEV